MKVILISGVYILVCGFFSISYAQDGKPSKNQRRVSGVTNEVLSENSQVINPDLQSQDSAGGSHQGSGQEESNNSAGAAANSMIGGLLISVGTGMLPYPTTPAGVALIGLGITGLMQAMANKKSANGMGNTYRATDHELDGNNDPTTSADVATSKDPFADGSGIGDGGPNDPLDPNTAPPDLRADVFKARQAFLKLKDQGFKVNEDGDLIDGQGNNLGNLMEASAKGLGAAGSQMASELTGKINGISNKVLDLLNNPVNPNQANVVKMDLQSPSGRSPSSFVSEGESQKDKAMKDYLKKLRDEQHSKKKMVAGLSVNYMGTKIGVREENIFDIIRRRYQSQRFQHAFIEDPNPMGNVEFANMER